MAFNGETGSHVSDFARMTAESDAAKLARQAAAASAAGDAEGAAAAANHVISTGAAGVSSFSAGTTGFTPNTATSGGIVLGGVLNVSNGGTGATTAGNALINLGGTATGIGIFTAASQAAAQAAIGLDPIEGGTY